LTSSQNSSVVLVTCALIERSGKLLLARRPAGKALAGKWEFPGGKVDPGESLESSLRREIEEELGCCVKVVGALSAVGHSYPGGRIELSPFRCVIMSGEPQALEHDEITWLEPAAIRRLDLADADQPILEEYLELLSGGHGTS
jgi:8-oxo-dGTP diphosphatase